MRVELETDMPRFAANLSMMYSEYAFMERFAAAAADGFSAVEYWLPYAYAASDLRAALDQAGLQQLSFNACVGNWEQGERGISIYPGREAEFHAAFELALNYASQLGNPFLHVMAGFMPDPHYYEKHRAVFMRNLSHAALLASRVGITLLIEPINQRDMPGYFLSSQEQAQQICQEIGVDNLRVQFDIYHCQISQGDVSRTLQRDLHSQPGGIAHIQIAGVPDRHEPDQGELNYPYLFDLLDQSGYAGWVACEYQPRGGTSAGLQWLRDWRARQP